MARWKKRKGKVIIPSHGAEFPKDPESRLEALLVGLNTEPKQVLILACLDTSWKTAYDLWHQWNDLGVDWIPQTNTLVGYLENNLMPYGLVRSHSVLFRRNNRPVKRYKLSNAGGHYGQLAAALMLQYSVERQISLYDILGSSLSSGKSRAPPNRVNLMRLFADGITSPKALMEKSGTDKASFRGHRSSLQLSGLIEYHRGVGGRLPKVSITREGQEFLDNLVQPLSLLCADKPSGAMKSAYLTLQELQGQETISQYAKNGIQHYRAVAPNRQLVKGQS